MSQTRTADSLPLRFSSDSGRAHEPEQKPSVSGFVDLFWELLVLYADDDADSSLGIEPH